MAVGFLEELFVYNLKISIYYFYSIDLLMDKGEWGLVVLGIISIIGIIIFANCVDGEPRDEADDQLIIPVWYKRRRKKKKRSV